MSGVLVLQEDREDYEIIDGVTYMMTRPSMVHAQIQTNILAVFKNYLKGKKCRPFVDGDVFLSENDNFVPDVMIDCNSDIIKKNGIFGAPDLVVEILSPSTANRDRIANLFAYEKYGVKEYWIVHQEEKSVEVYLRQDDKLILNKIYFIYPDYEWEKLTDEQKAEVPFEIKVSFYDDFYVKLEDIFEYVD